MPAAIAIITILAAYFIGAIPFGYLFARMRGVNIFEHGSGNIGATTVGRVLGKPIGFLVFVLDFTKGALPVGLAILLKPFFAEPIWTRGFVEVAAGLTAFLGHLFPIYLGFRGGKGVATGAGAVAVLVPIPAAVALVVWAVILLATRLMSLASLVAVVVLCAVHLRVPASWQWLEPRTWFCLIAGALVIIKHHANIGRLLKGTETQLKDGFFMQQLTKSLHVLALGLWFGMAIFFTFVVAFTIFGSFETLGQEHKRETWFPQPRMYRDLDAAIDAPKEQGTRAAGHVIGPLFLWYFAIQGACGFIALATALSWVKGDPDSRVHRWRVNLLLVGVAFVIAGWPLARHVNELREPRNRATEDFLEERTAVNKTAMQEARAEFGRWHLASVLLNLATIVCVTGAMALAGNLGSSTKDTKTHEEALQPIEPPQPEMGIKEGTPRA